MTMPTALRQGLQSTKPKRSGKLLVATILLLENQGLSRRQLTLALRAVLEHRDQLTEAWNRIHGQE